MTEATAPGTITRTFQIDIKAPIERVWREITKQNEKQRVMFDTMLEAEMRPGGTLRYRTVDQKMTPIWGEVVEVDEPRLFAHTFAFSNIDDAPTLVRWELEQEGEVCRVTVTHSRFEGETKTLKSVAKVWPAILGRLKDVVEGRNIPMGMRMQYAMMRWMSFMAPKSMRTDTVEEKVASMKDGLGGA